MRYRGPDGINHWVNGSVALGQCMLRTTPESLEETQPLINEDESLVLVMDGRLDNWEELRSELLSRGAQLRTRADAELVLRAYEAWGEACLAHIDGDFAFAIWDTRKRDLFCARDRIGVRSFLYHTGKTFFAFATDEAAFHSLPNLPPRPNEHFLAAALCLSFYGGNYHDTWLDSVVKLPPGNLLRVRNGARIAQEPYWQFQVQDESHFATDEACFEAFQSVLRHSIRRRLRACRPCTLMLSGGIDSASIAAISRDLSQQGHPALRRISVIDDIDPQNCLETRNILSIGKSDNSEAILAGISGRDGIVTNEDLKELAWPDAHPHQNSILLPATMYRSARRAGSNVMLDGIDGDLATFAPALYMLESCRSGRLIETWREAYLASIRSPYLNQTNPLSIFARCLWVSHVPERTRMLRRAFLRSPPTDPGLWNLTSRDFANRMELESRIANQGRKGLAAAERGLQAHHIHALTSPGIAWGTETFDVVAARQGVEARHPWTDLRVLLFCQRLPLRFRARNGWTKFALRGAISPLLDRQSVWQSRKAHLGFRLTERLVACSNDEIAAARHAAPSILRNVANLQVVDKLLQPGSEPLDNYAVDKVLTLVSAIRWLQKLQTVPAT